MAPQETCGATLLKRIWTFWNDGEAKAPPVVRYCLLSWRARNLSWNVEVLNSFSVKQYLSEGQLRTALCVKSFAAFSGMLRITLLKVYEGVWVDATLWCRKLLDD